MSGVQDFAEAFGNPSMRHAMLVHFPVVLSVAGIVLAVLAASLGERIGALRWTALAVYLALGCAALAARFSGEDAAEAVEGSLTEAGHLELEGHESHGRALWIWPAAVSALLGASFIRRSAVRLGASWVAVGVSVLAADRVAHTAHHGGRLVYVHGAAAGTRSFEAPAGDEPPAAAPSDPRVAFFRDQVRPILSEHCIRCHNPRRARRSGGLDQTTIAGLLAGGVSGPAIVPGQPEASLLISAVRWDDPDLKMPAGRDQLPPEQIAALERWIAEGAVWETWELPAEGASAPGEAEGEREAEGE